MRSHAKFRVHSWVSFANSIPRGEVSTIYAGTDVPFVRGAFSSKKNFWGIIFGKITGSDKFLVVTLEN